MDAPRERELPLFSQAAVFHSRREVCMHTHPGTELIFLEAGECRVDTPQESFSCRAGDLLVVAPETPHNQSASPGVKTFFVTFVCSPERFNPTTRKLRFDGDTWVRHLMYDICRLSEETRYHLCSGLLDSLLNQIIDLEELAAGRGKIHPAVRTLIELYENRFQEPLSIEQLAGEVHLSASYLRALFVRDTGMAPQGYLQNVRMAHARKLLLNSYWEVSEVARLSGYSDANYFTRLFRKVHRCTPGEFRRISQTRPESFIRL